ncbi:hypothetical protein QTO34_006575 [Cnephaeus nilssonii]|uniref:non-specific serine/threonine protein kinase n=1 Tax=Cnephaeus nilssonii TaxID=3371016 RepID=A0AA40HLH7_CNENI|nr:hypothetical protein QTO34_006575 [Eptesicus nilssonii]
MSNDFSAPSDTQEHCIGDYVLQYRIGHGACAKVYLAWHVPTGTEHPNITELFEVIATPDVLYLVMEHVREGDLREHLESHGPLSERQARAAFRQVVSALQYCHRRGIAHRDLKPDNILLDEDGTVKLADFGFGRRVSDDSKLSTFCGTFYYMAPEGQSLAKIKRQVLAGQFEAPHRMSREGKQLLRWLLTVDPSQRPTLDEVLEMMQTLGFEPDQVEQSVGERKYDREMGTYLILRMMETKMPGRKVKSSILHTTVVNVTGPPPSLESMTTPPPLESIEFGTAPPSPDLQLGPGGSPRPTAAAPTAAAAAASGVQPQREPPLKAAAKLGSLRAAPRLFLCPQPGPAGVG